MQLSKDQVKHVAKLASLPITEEEEDLYAQQLSKILNYIDQLNVVNTDGIEPTFNVSPQANIMRSDEVKESLSQDQAVKNAPQTQDGFFITKGVFENE